MIPKHPLAILFGGFVILFIAWLATGGPQIAQQTGSDHDKFIEPLDPLKPTKTYDAPWFGR